MHERAVRDQLVLDGLTEFLDRIGRSEEQITRKFPKLYDVAHDPPCVLEIRAHPGEILEPQIQVAIDLCVRKPGAEIGSASSEVRKEINCAANADVA